MAKCSASLTLTHVLDGSKGDPGIQGPPGEKGADARTYVALSSGYDLNDCKVKDTVYVTSSTAICNSLQNRPDGFIAGECRLEVEWLGSDGYFIQRLFCKAGDESKSFSRTYSSGSFGPWVELGTKGDKGDKGNTGAPALVWDFKPSQQTYLRNRRLTTSQRITITADIQGYGFTPSWECSQSNVLSTVADTGDKIVELVIPYNNAYDSLTITMKYGSTVSSSRTLSVVDATSRTMFLGSVNELPVTAGREKLLDGDFFVVAEEFTEDSKTYSKAVPYVYSGGEWQPLDSTDRDFDSKMMLCLGSLFRTKTDIPSSAVITYAYVKNLAVQSAMIENMFTKKIALMEQGEIASKNWYDNPSPEQRFRITANGEADFYGITAKNATIDGESIFNGTIQSTALSTTLEKAGGGSSYSTSLGTSKYWKYSQLESLLDSAGFSNGYTSISGSYSTLRKGTSKITLKSNTSVPYASGTMYTGVRPQQIELAAELYSTSTGISDFYYTVGGTTYSFLNVTTGGKSYSRNHSVSNGTVISRLDGYTNTQGTYTIYDVQSQFTNKYAFWNSSGTLFNPSTYNSGTITVNSVTPPVLYKWGGMSSSSGGGECSSGTLTLKNEDGSVNILGKSIYSVYWTSANEITFTTTDLAKYTVNTSNYYQAFSASFTVKTSVNSVQTVSITPKQSSNNIGTTNNPFNEGNFKTLKGNLTGNVNASGTSNLVWGAVFN